ncbi:hypothetical protein C5C18_03805 [Rathayibacter tritici]|nr:hypothetical protein C5C06_00495 [Rathayibacter tritici]PPF70239.1 hypothetical protein C5C21_01355 [Rathayibacter tritici]PPG08522.1 hypothetical protein C5C18_03805 [Rathayibacter tritici]
MAAASSAMYSGYSYRTSMTPVPISLQQLRGDRRQDQDQERDASCGAKWYTRTSAPSVPVLCHVDELDRLSRTSHAVWVTDPGTD